MKKYTARQAWEVYNELEREVKFQIEKEVPDGSIMFGESEGAVLTIDNDTTIVGVRKNEKLGHQLIMDTVYGEQCWSLYSDVFKLADLIGVLEMLQNSK